MYQVEAHLTTDLTEDLWASLDVSQVSGGEATIDGQTGEELDNLGIGYTFGYQINENLKLTVGYMATVNDDGPTDLNMDGFTVSLVYGWHELIQGMNRLKEN